MSEQSRAFTSLHETIRRLRGADGCPWDRKQTTASLRHYLIEEFSEILAAIDKEDPDNLCEELGDFLYLILMLGEINREEGRFSIEQILTSITDKLIRRHPHVFDAPTDLSDGELRSQWERIKEQEKAVRKSSVGKNSVRKNT